MSLTGRAKSLGMKTPLRGLIADARYLKGLGWGRSWKEGASVDSRGHPVPWLCYPANTLLAERVKPGLRVFEWGSGGSTLWWANRGATVVACENDDTWFRRVTASAPSGATIVHRDLGELYIEEPVHHEPFDVVVIDGFDRNACSSVAAKCLTDRGVIIWDNTDRERYKSGLDGLRAAGFRVLTLSGMAPMVSRPTSTSIIYRDGNALGL